MLRISKLTDYGTMVLAYMGRRPDKLCSAAEIADALHLGQPTVSKILKTLARRHLLLAFRGTNGGYTLARAPQLISIAEIIDAMEDQPFGLTECSAHEGLCTQEESCLIRANWKRINVVVRHALEGVSLADMIGPPPASVGKAAVVPLRRRAGMMDS
ncbi:MAG: SUF system Fe-S cluster assembly regulator [Pseudomonadota bacterium]